MDICLRSKDREKLTYTSLYSLYKLVFDEFSPGLLASFTTKSYVLIHINLGEIIQEIYGSIKLSNSHFQLPKQHSLLLWLQLHFS